MVSTPVAGCRLGCELSQGGSESLRDVRGVMVSLQSTLRYLDPFRGRGDAHRMSGEERSALLTINQKIAAKPSLNDVCDYLFETTQEVIPFDRIGLAFLEEQGGRLVSHYARAKYEPLLLTKGYVGELRGSSLESIVKTGQPRIIGDLERYLQDHPGSHSSYLLVREGVRSSLTCPLVVEGRVLGFLFRSSREKGTYGSHHVELQTAINERLSQAMEKAWRIEQLTAANHAYMEMLAFVSHEIKNPVASMVTDAKLLSGGYLGELDESQRDKVDRLIKKGEYLLDLVGEYLDLARIEGGELAVDPREVDVVAEVVAPCLDLVHSQLVASGMRLDLRLPKETVMAECDPGLLRIVLANLLGNACKYGKQGGEIRVAVVREPSRLEVSVWNEGVGFPPEDRAKLFRRFSRLNRPEFRGMRGTGVGLYTAWRIIQLHRGRIRARSEPGSWAEFAFELSQPLMLDAVPAPSRGGG
jgi:signal transduction histidine kinase